MRISDWSSDVYSSDLTLPGRCVQPLKRAILADEGKQRRHFGAVVAAGERKAQGQEQRLALPAGHFLQFPRQRLPDRSEEHTSELQSLMRISYAVFCLKKKKTNTRVASHTQTTNLN